LTPIRKATFAVLIALALLLAFSAAAVAGPIAAKKAKLAAVQAQLSTVYEKSDMAVERYNEAAARLDDVQDRIVRNEHLLEVAEDKLELANDHLTARARQVYKAESTGILDVVFASHTFDDLLTQLDVMQRMTENDATTAHAADVYRQEIADRRISLEADRKSTVKLVAQREESKDEVLALQSQLESTVGGLKDEIADLQAKAAAAAKAKAEAAARAAAVADTSSGGSSSGGSSSSSSSGGGGGGRSGSSRISTPTWPAAISRSASTVGLSFSQSSVAPEPFASLRARREATSTSWNRFGTFWRQSSTVMRAIVLGNELGKGARA